jgi:hypothetical protein
VKSLRVPQREVRAEIRLHGGQTRSGLLFVPAQGPDGSPGRLTDRLNDADEAFLALRDEATGVLVSKHRIVHVELPRSEVAVEVVDAVTQVAARVQLADGSALDGVLPYAMPPDRARLLDYLNTAPGFLQLVAGEKLVLVNRDFITTVTRADDDDDGSS